jgi:NADPH2:quinone reductase
MKRVVVDHFGGPEVVTVIDDEIPRPAPGEVRVPKPPFTPGYENLSTASAAPIPMVRGW